MKKTYIYPQAEMLGIAKEDILNASANQLTLSTDENAVLGEFDIGGIFN